MKSFTLAQELAHDTVPIGAFNLCLALLMDDANYPWVILVPQRPAIREIYELHETDQRNLLAESSHLARKLAETYHADKINIGALGNMVPQLHLHHVVRYKTDAAWPHPVWGRVARQPYSQAIREERLAELRKILF